MIRKTPPTSTSRGAYDAIIIEAGFKFWERGFCPVCTGKVPADKYKKNGDPSLTVWVLFTKGQFEIKKNSKRVLKAPLNQLRDALRLYA